MENPVEHTPIIKPAGDNRMQILTPLILIGLVVIGVAAGYGYRTFKTTVPPGSPQRDLAKEAEDELARQNFKPLSESLQTLLADTKYEPIPTQAHQLLLQQAPEFELKDVDGKVWSLDEHLKTGPVVLVFYYGYHCNHCVSQLFALNKDIAKFSELGVHVVAVSADPVELTRERYKQYGAFKFPVLSDSNNNLAEKYETYSPAKEDGKEGDLMHGTYVISRHGKIVWANRGDTPFTENRTLIHKVAEFEGRLPKKAGS